MRQHGIPLTKFIPIKKGQTTMNPDLTIEDAKFAVAAHLHALEVERAFWHTLRSNMSAATPPTIAYINGRLTTIAADKAPLVEMAGILAAL